jgi:hypothetical protein
MDVNEVEIKREVLKNLYTQLFAQKVQFEVNIKGLQRLRILGKNISQIDAALLNLDSGLDEIVQKLGVLKDEDAALPPKVADESEKTN